MAQRNESISIFYGILLLLGMHVIAIIAIFILGYILFFNNTGYSILFYWIYTYGSLFLIQLVYVIPVVLRLKQQQRWGMMKGVIIGAVITALLNGGCWLLFFFH